MTEPEKVDGGVDVEMVCAVNQSGLADQHVPRQAGVGEEERRVTEQDTTEENLDDRLALMDQDALKREFWAIMKMAVPVAATGTLQIMFVLLALMFVGGFGERGIAVTGLATMFFNVTGLSIVIGLSSGLDTFASQFYGAGQFRLVGVVLQRCLVLCMACCVPIFILWMYTARFLVLFGIEPALAGDAARYVHIMSLGVIPCFMFEAMRKYLQCQGLMKPALYAISAAVIVHLVMLYLVVKLDLLGLGIFGGALSLAIGNFACAGFLFAHIRYTRVWQKTWIIEPGTWHGWTWECLDHVLDFLWIAAPSAGSLCLEWWCFEIITLFSGRLGTTVVAAQTIMFNTTACTYLFGLGIAVAATTRVGNALGGNRATSAQRSMIVSVASLAIIITVVAFTLYTLRESWISLFTSDPAVMAATTAVMPIQTSFIAFDAQNGVLSGILRGAGHQKVGFFAALGSYYGLGLPLGLYLAFEKDMGLSGLWYGLALGSITCCVAQGWYLSRVSWDQIADQAAERVEAHRGSESERSLRIQSIIQTASIQDKDTSVHIAELQLSVLDGQDTEKYKDTKILLEKAD